MSTSTKVTAGRSALMQAAYQANPGDWMGSLYLGVMVDLLFLGILCSQVSAYYTNSPKDSTWVKRLVAFVLSLSIAKSVISFIVVWDKNIIGFGDWNVAISIPWNLWIEPPAAVVMATAAQSFFVWRCFNLTSRNWYLLAVLVTLLLTVLGFSIASSAQYIIDSSDAERLKIFAGPMLGIGAFVDIIISTVVSFKLARSRKGFSSQTDTILNQLLAITWESAAPPAISQLINLILFITTAQKGSWHVAVNMLTPRLYVFSLLHTLNSRTSIRLQSSQGTTGHELSQHGGGRPRPSGVLPLAVLGKRDRNTQNPTGTIPVHVQTETIVHEDPQGHSQSVLAHGGVGINVGKLKSVRNSRAKSEDGESLDSSRWENSEKAIREEDVEDEAQPYSRHNTGTHTPESNV